MASSSYSLDPNSMADYRSPSMMSESALSLPHELVREDSNIEPQQHFVAVVLNPEEEVPTRKQHDYPPQEKRKSNPVSERVIRSEKRKSTPANGVLLVDWDGPTDPANPKNWSQKQKWAATFVISSFTFISPLASSMIAPASEQVAHRFGITNTVVIAMLTSIFVLGYAVGPLVSLFWLATNTIIANLTSQFLGPLSEIYGRSRVMQGANLFFLVWNTACGFAQSETQLMVFRLLAGLGGSAPLAIGGGVLGDTWLSEERGKAIAIYSLAPLLGPVVGPVCGGWIAEKSTWRWVFWSTSIVDVGIQISGLFFLRETFAPVLLERKAKQIRSKLDLENGPRREIRTIYETGDGRSWKAIFGKALTRPFKLFGGESIVQILGIYMAFIYGIFYLFLTTIPSIFRKNYHEDDGISGLHYLALGIGLSLASQLNAQYMDRIYVYMKKKNNNVGEPEFRLPTIIPGSVLLPFGLLLSGWAAQHNFHWVVVDIGILCVGAGMILAFQGIQTYVVDAFTLHAASALAAVSCLRSLAGFGFPLFAPTMYNKLGYGKGNTILACFAIALGCPAPLLLLKYGKRIRMGSKYASKQTRQSPVVESTAATPTVIVVPVNAAAQNQNEEEKKPEVIPVQTRDTTHTETTS